MTPSSIHPEPDRLGMRSLIELAFPDFAKVYATRVNGHRLEGNQPTDGEMERGSDQLRSLQDIVHPSSELAKQEEYFLKASPLPIEGREDPRQDAIDLLRALFLPDEFVFAAWRVKSRGILDRTVRTRREWEEVLQVWPHLPTVFLPNPIVAVPRPTKNGKKCSMRGDQSIQSFRHATVEFPMIPPAEQCEFWAGLDLSNLAALVSTGVGSLQGFMRIDAADKAEWRKCYDQTWLLQGCRPRCAIPSFLARLAGGMRALVSKEDFERGDFQDGQTMVRQRLLYVRPELTAGDLP